MTSTIATPARKSNTTFAWLVYVVQLLGTAVLAVFGLTSVFMTDSCGSVEVDKAVCNGNYLAWVLFSYWGALLILAIVVPILIVKASRHGKSAGLRAMAGLILVGALTVLFVTLVVR